MLPRKKQLFYRNAQWFRGGPFISSGQTFVSLNSTLESDGEKEEKICSRDFPFRHRCNEPGSARFCDSHAGWSILRM